MKTSFIKTIKVFLLPIRYSKFNFIASVICWFFWALVSVYLVIYLKYITNAIENNDWGKVKIYSIICFLVITCWYLISIFYKVFPFWFAKDVHSNLYRDIMEKFFKWSNTKIETIWTGRIISIIQKWLWAWLELLIEVSWRVFNKVFIIIIIFYTIWKSNIYVMFIWIIWVLFSSLWLLFFYPKALKWRQKCKNCDTEIDKTIILHIMNKFEIYQNNKQDLEVKKIYEKNNEWYYNKIREKIWQWVSYDWIEYFASISLLSTAFYFSYLIFNSSATLGDFVLFTWFAILLWNQIRIILELSTKFTDSYIHIEKMNEMLENISEKSDKSEEEKCEYIYKNWDIEVKSINFSYDKSRVFKNFSLFISWWTKTAFVWESGGWKSTLIKLLAWYMDIDSGEILIDWQKLSNIKLSDYYKHIWYLTQDPSVFDWTIIENLTYALSEKPNEIELEKCIKLSKCEFIFELEKWLETEIWERWIRLSWWQKQRLAIAKIMLKNPNIILLDEPTSALDSFNEEMINLALHNLFKWKTVIIIAHRLQTVKEADEILVIENWEIVERWTHGELVKNKWIYKKMLDLQSGF